jgi:hypothetical protein
MRRAERTAVGKLAAGKLAGNRGDHRDIEQFGRRERRQDRRQALRQHRLAGAGRADHQEIVAAGGGDLERALGGLLSLDVGKVGQVGHRLAPRGLRARQDLGAAEMIGERDQARGRDDVDILAGPGRFRAALFRADQALRCALAAIAAGSTPATGAMVPSSDNSPSTT